MADKCLPYIFDPIFIEKPWGGSRLTGKPGTGEAFLISDFADAYTLSNNKSVANLISTLGSKFLGPKLSQKYSSKLPVYAKEIDAADNLSIQVHPNDEQAMKLEAQPFGKSESWYILNSDKESGLYLGFKNGVDSKVLLDSLNKKQDISKLMNFVPVNPKDFFYIPAGLVHAIGKGVHLLEPQQNSNTTYRLWDWWRLDSKGNERELHIDNALKVINFDPTFNKKYSTPIKKQGNLLLDEKYFKVEEFSSNTEGIKFSQHDSYRLILPIDCSLTINCENNSAILNKTHCCLIPSYMKNFSVSSKEISSFLLVSVY